MTEKELTEQIAKRVKDCGSILLEAQHMEKNVIAKEGRANFVTAYDKKVQERLCRELLELLPEAKFLGEEGEQEQIDVSKGYVYIVDPIDGTTNFMKGYQMSAISAALARDGEVICGVVYNPYLDELFTACKGQGAFLNGKPIHVSAAPLSEGLVLFGTSPYHESLAEKSFQTAYEYFKQALDVRRSGSAALDLCNIAAGRAELFFELILQPWDYAAGSLMIQEAGGVITDMEGGPITLDCPCGILATNKTVRV